jgi:predicted short-subunit dehydrogenase-like oxidoreductase (DUF2520 family)
MRISFYGSGNAAHHLAKGLHLAGHEIVQIWSRKAENAYHLATLVQAEGIADIRLFNTNIDVIIICIPDDYIAPASKTLAHICDEKSLVCHCSGTVSSEVLSTYFHRYGVFYPLQTLSKERAIDASDIPIGITAHDGYSLSILMTLSQAFSSYSRVISDEERRLIHLPAVLVNNFTNALYDMAFKYCEQQDLPFEFLIPLIQETANKIAAGLTPEEAMTGPARRNDQNTIIKHLNLIENDATLSRIYQQLSLYITKLYHENRP